MTDSGAERLDDQLRIAAELARDAADAISAWQAREPDFAGDDEARSAYEEALQSLADAYSLTTHSGLGLVSGELLAAALPALAMHNWDAAAELAKVGAAYAEVEAKGREQGKEKYEYAGVPYSLAAVGIVNWYAPDLAAEALADLARHARDIAQASFGWGEDTEDAPTEEGLEEPDRMLILQLSDDCSALDAAGGFAHASRPPLDVLVDATITSVVRGDWGGAVYPFATATAVLAEYQAHWLAVGTTWHFEHDVRRLRPYIDPDMCRSVIASPLRTERQADGRIRHWGWITLPGEAEPRILRVVTLEDGETILTAFLDRNFPRKWRRSP